MATRGRRGQNKNHAVSGNSRGVTRLQVLLVHEARECILHYCPFANEIHGNLDGYAALDTVLFPSIKTWQGVKATVATDGLALIAYYDDNPTNKGTLWTPSEECARDEGHVPRLLHIPVLLHELICNKGHLLMPHEVLKLVLTNRTRTIKPRKTCGSSLSNGVW